MKDLATHEVTALSWPWKSIDNPSCGMYFGFCYQSELRPFLSSYLHNARILFLQSAFNINASRMPSTIQPEVTVLGPHGNVHANVITTDHGVYRVAWAPTHAGKHRPLL